MTFQRKARAFRRSMRTLRESATSCIMLAAFTVATLGAAPAWAQPAEGTFCGEPNCSEVLRVPFVTCDDVWSIRTGRTLYGPLLYRGGLIEISVEARPVAPPEFQYPLYFEIIGGTCGQCQCHGPGSTVWQTYGTESCDSTFVDSGPISLKYVVPEGGEYWLQVLSLRTLPTEFPPPRYVQSSASYRCVQVRELTTPVAPIGWTQVKALYQ